MKIPNPTYAILFGIVGLEVRVYCLSVTTSDDYNLGETVSGGQNGHLL